MKKVSFSILNCICSILIGLFVLPENVQAIVDPLATPNNKYGIHIIDESDLENAAALVNSSGGDWGYVTIVLPDNERNKEKWEAIFASMQRFHLIPLLRIATHVEGNVWAKPQLTDINEWAEFLSGLPWFTKNRYIIVFNEPNHAKEWGNTIQPEEYAQFLDLFTRELKERSDDFFVLPAGLDASAPNGRSTIDEASFLRRMFASNPDVFEIVDGWNSHSYPNPNFSGSVHARGKGTLKTYQWELAYLKTMGVSKQFPVFITETGWVHSGGDGKNRSYFSPEKVADFITIAADLVWSDPSIVSLTPFLLNYPVYPFAQFSWQKPAEVAFYPQYDAYRSIAKIAGQPLLQPTQTPTPTITPTLLPTRFVLSTESEVEKGNLLGTMFNLIKDWISSFF